jgi:hypothetical protein
VTYERCDSCRGDSTAGPDGEHRPISRICHVSFDTAHATAADPNRASRLPASRRSGKAAFRKFRCLEAAVRDLTHPAIKRHSIADPDRQVKRLTAVIQFAGVAGYCRAEPVFSLMTSLTSSFSE